LKDLASMASGTPARLSLTHSARRFLEWWRDELLGLVPQRLLADADASVVLVQVEGGFQIIGTSSSRDRREANAPVLSRVQALAALAEMAASQKTDTIGVRLPFSQCFERRVELPKAAGADLKRMLNFDLERATPFRLGDVYTAALPTGETGAKGKQRVRQLVLKREAVDPLIADAKAAGLATAFVDCWQTTPAAGLPVNFLEANEPPRSDLARHATFPRLLAVLALVLAGLAGVLSMSRYEAALAEVKTETTKLRTQAAAVREAIERSGAAVADLARLQRMKLGQVPAVEVLEELSRLLPDSVWLTDLRIEGDAVDLTGLAKSGAALPSLFVGSTLFADAALTAPVTLDQREDKERFSLRIRLRPLAAASLPGAAPAPAPEGRP
jgi:general secretion pathway protein L